MPLVRSSGMTTATPDPLVGLVLDGKYQIEARVGAGAMGAVYRARHLSLGALRAIRVMKAELATDPFDMLEIVGLFLVICWPIILISAVRIGW